MPTPARAVHERVRALRAGTARGIFFRRALLPDVEKRLQRTPTTFDLVGALKQRLVPNQHVVEQRLVAGLLADLEMVLVTEVHTDRRGVDDRPRTFDDELQVDSFVR